MDVLIPEPGGPILCGQVLAGQIVCGQDTAPDGWTTQPLDLLAGSATVKTDATITAATGTVELLAGNAEVLVTAPVDVPITVEVTGTLDLAASAAEVSTPRDVTVTAGTGELALDGGAGSAHLDVIITEGDLDQLLCGPTRITGQWICGHVFSGKRWNKYTLDLANCEAVITLTVNPSLVAVDWPLELLADPAEIHWDTVLSITPEDTLALELAGVEGVRINPILIPFDCVDLDLSASTCTPLAPPAVVVSTLDIAVSARVDLDAEASPVEEAEPDPIVCLEA